LLEEALSSLEKANERAMIGKELEELNKKKQHNENERQKLL
jgi:hypothetical protein